MLRGPGLCVFPGDCATILLLFTNTGPKFKTSTNPKSTRVLLHTSGTSRIIKKAIGKFGKMQ